ncbi:response regulator [Pseudomonas sp. RIT-PI-S]|uniref:response regulator transcription factor n=1 Tax=Pseudomonas sp. RIT-PI-S TaxID=3035295 RepID=UPI0021DABF0D|nr:response regulator [Pseudomonas sp. RIT-PI-S]
MHVVCVVDDDFSVRKSLANLLKSAGYQPICFDSGEAFLASPAIDTAACVVLDLCMPGLSGHQVQQQLRARGKKLPVVCISANGNGADTRSLAEGAACFLAKPFTGETLLNAIEAAMQGKP